MEYKSFPAEFQIKQDNSEGMTFESYISTFGNVDDGSDLIKKGAYKKTLRERFKQGQGSLIKVLRQHYTLIGIPLAMKEDDHGVFTDSKVSRTPLGLETMMLIRDEALDRMSIGYKAVKWERDEETGIRTLKEIKLFEYSVVDFAMNEMAQITAAKAMAMLEDDEVRTAFAYIAEEKFNELMLKFDTNSIVAKDKSDDSFAQQDKLKNAILSLNSFKTALQDLLEPSNNTQEKPSDIDTSKANELDPVVLQSMLNEIRDVTKTFSQIQ